MNDVTNRRRGGAEFPAGGAVPFEEYLDRNGSLTYSNLGVSMLPLLRQGRDLFTVEKKGPERCRVGDVALYRRGRDYVLHRIVEVRENDYVLLGDNCVQREYGVTDADILGVLTGFVRDGKTISVRDPAYRLYTGVWLRTEKPRIFCKRVLARLRREFR